MLQLNLDQHYLIDTSVIDIITRYIISYTDIDAPLIEIGAGKGALTQRLLNNLRSVIALELDPGNCEELEQLKANYQLLQIYQTDALNWLKDNKTEDPNVLKYVVGNIPYSIAEP